MLHNVFGNNGLNKKNMKMSTLIPPGYATRLSWEKNTTTYYYSY